MKITDKNSLPVISTVIRQRIDRVDRWNRLWNDLERLYAHKFSIDWWSGSTLPATMFLIGIGWIAQRFYLHPPIEEKVWSQCGHNNLISDVRQLAWIFWTQIFKLLVCMFIVLGQVRGTEVFGIGPGWSLVCHSKWRRCLLTGWFATKC